MMCSLLTECLWLHIDKQTSSTDWKFLQSSSKRVMDYRVVLFLKLWVTFKFSLMRVMGRQNNVIY